MDRSLEFRQMRASLARLGLFLLPVLLLLLLPLHVLWRSGEIVSLRPEQVLERQRDAQSTLLFGPAYSNCAKRYKVLGARAAAAQVLVLGSSRSMHFRAGLFPERVSFYNAGGGASRVGHLREFLAALPRESQPKVLILGLDQWWFNARTAADPEPPFQAQVSRCDNLLNLVQSSWRPVYADLASGKFGLAGLAPQRAIGLNALVNGNGFRNDGSYVYGRFMANPADPHSIEDFHYRDTYRRIRSGTGRFSGASAPDPALVAELAAFLDEAKRRGIHVTAFLPPFPAPVNAALVRSGRYAYMDKLAPVLAPEFTRRGDVLVDLRDLRPLGIGEEGFVDGVHAAERAHARMLEEILARDPGLAPYIETERLQQLLQHSPGPLALATTRLR